MKISVTTPFSGKYFCFLEYAKTIEQLVKNNLEIEFIFSVLDNSNRSSFERRINDLADKLGIKLYYKKEDTRSIPNVGNDRMKRVNELYNDLIFNVMPQDIDYCFVIEDDIVFDDPDAIKKCLRIMEDDTVATVTANTLARWERGRFGKPQCSEYINQGDLVDIKLELSGVRQVDTAAMGFWFTRMSVLKRLGLPLGVNGRKATDGCWSENLINHNYKLMLDQSIHCRHYYQKEDGMINYVSPTHNTDGTWARRPKPSFEHIIQRTERKGSPQFIKVINIKNGK